MRQRLRALLPADHPRRHSPAVGHDVARGQVDLGEETEGRDLAVDRVQVLEQDAPSHVALLLGLAGHGRVITRRRRYVLDGKPVLRSSSYLPAKLAAGSPITTPDTGPNATTPRAAPARKTTRATQYQTRPLSKTDERSLSGR